METIRIKLNLKTDKPLDEFYASEQIKAAMNNLVKFGAFKGEPDKILHNYDIILGPTNYAILDIAKDAYIDSAPLASVGAEKISDEVLPEGNSVLESNKTFSQATINERLRIAKMDPKQRCRYTVMDYKRFWKAHGEQLKSDPENAKCVTQMFISDFMNMFNTILPHIEEGKQLNSLLGLQVIAPGISKEARELSMAYRRALKSEASNGAPTPALYKILASKYRAFLNELLLAIFPGIEGIQVNRGEDKKIPVKEEPTSEETKAESVKTYSILEDGRIDLFT
jgi:hypothetical protein